MCRLSEYSIDDIIRGVQIAIPAYPRCSCGSLIKNPFVKMSRRVGTVATWRDHEISPFWRRAAMGARNLPGGRVDNDPHRTYPDFVRSR